MPGLSCSPIHTDRIWPQYSFRRSKEHLNCNQHASCARTCSITPRCSFVSYARTLVQPHPYNGPIQGHYLSSVPFLDKLGTISESEEQYDYRDDKGPKSIPLSTTKRTPHSQDEQWQRKYIQRSC